MGATGIILGRSIYGGSGTGSPVFITELELQEGAESDFGFPEEIDLNTVWSSSLTIEVKSGALPMSKYDGVIEKQPNERRRIYHDFSPELLSTTLITSIVSITAIKISDGTDATATIIADLKNITEDGKRVYYGLKDGADGEDYKVTIVVGTDEVVGTGLGGVVEAEHLIQVRNH